MPTSSSFDVDVRGDISAHIRGLNALQREVIPVATVTSLNKTATTVRSKARRETAIKMGVQQKEIAKAFYINKATLVSRQAKITAKPWKVSLLKFKARQMLSGVAHTAVGVDNPLAHAFIATMPNGKPGVFKRLTKKRLPIAKQYGTTPAQAFGSAAIFAYNKDLSVKRFNEVFPKEMRYRLMKAGLL